VLPKQVAQGGEAPVVSRQARRPSVDENNANSPTLDALNETQYNLLLQMRARLSELPSSRAPPRRHDLWLKRFLAHGKWKLEKAMELYLEMEAWRLECGADRILEEIPDGGANKVLPIDLIGFYPYSYDKIGRPIAWMRVGLTPWWRPLYEQIEEGIRSQLWMGELIDTDGIRRARETGIWRERAVILVDLSQLDMAYFTGLSWSARARQRGTLMSVAKYYPGIVDKSYILHAPGFANKAWNVLKMFLSEALMQKAVMVSSNEELELMLDDLGRENVPRSLGGLSDAPTGARIPPHLTMPAGGWSAVLDEWRPREISISAKTKYEEIVELLDGQHVRWQWALVSFSIVFQVERRATDGEFKTVSPNTEYSFLDVRDDPLCDEVSAPAGGGVVRLVWNNESSAFRQKTLLLKLKVF